MDKLLFYTLNNKGLPSGPNFNRTNTLGKLSMLKEGGDMFSKKPLMPKFNHGGTTHPESWLEWGNRKALELEKGIDGLLGSPSLRATKYAKNYSEPGAPSVDNIRHAASGLMTSEGIEAVTGHIPIVSKAMGFLGSNLLGAAHEITNINTEDGWYNGFREAGEDMYNNLFGSYQNLKNIPHAEKLKIIAEASRTKSIPDGHGVTKKKHGGQYYKFEEGGEKDAAWAARIRAGLGPEYANYNDQQIREIYDQGNIMSNAGEDFVAPDLKEVTITSETDKERRDAYLARTAKYFREEKPRLEKLKNFIASDGDWKWLSNQQKTIEDYTINPIIDGVNYVAEDPGQATRDVVNTVADGVSWVGHEGNLDPDGRNIFGAKYWDHAEGAMHVVNAIPAAGLLGKGANIVKKVVSKPLTNYARDISKGAVKKLKKSSTNQVLTQQERLLNEEIKKKFFRQQAELPIEEIPVKGFNLNKVPKDMHNRITPENYEEFVNKIHGSTGYQTAKKSNKLPTNVGVGNYSSPGIVFTDATVKKTGKPLSNIGKDVVAAHEKNHGMFHGTLSEKMKNALLKPFKGGAKIFEGYGAKDWADEVFARMGQMKNALGFKGNEVFTKKHLDLLRKDYTKDYIDNSMSNLFNKLTPGSKAEKEFIKNMNKYAFGAAAVATGAVSKKAYGGQISTNNNATEPEYTYLELDDDAIQQYRDGGYVVEEMPEYEEGGNVISPGDGWEYKKEGDTYFTKQEGDTDWIDTTGNTEAIEAIKSKIYKEPTIVNNTIIDPTIPNNIATDNATIDNTVPNSSIVDIQTKLVDAGYNIGYYGDGKPLIDGNFGRKTKAALDNYNKGIAPEPINVSEPIVNAEPVEIPTRLNKEVQIPEYIGNLEDGFLPTLKEYGEETCSKEGKCSFNTSKKMGNLLANSVPDLKKLWAEDAWFNKDKMLKDQGSLIYNTEERNMNKMQAVPKELYSKLQVGDYVHLNRYGSTYEGDVNKNDPTLKNEKVEHMGFIIGKDEDGTPLVWHGSETGIAYVQRLDQDIELKDHNLKYQVASIVRNPELKEFNEEAKEMLLSNPYYSPFDSDIKISNPPLSTATPTQKTAYESVNKNMKRFKDRGYDQSETAMVGQLLVGGIMHMESTGNTGVSGYYKRGILKQPGAYIWKEGLGQGQFEGDEASWGVYQMKPNYNFKEGKYLTRYEYDDQGKKIKGSAYEVSNPKYGQLNDLGKKLQALGVEVDDIFDSYENQTIAGQVILLENYKSLKQDPKFDKKTGLWDGRIPASYILAKSWQAGSGWQNRDKYQKYLEDTDITYSEEALKNAVKSGWMNGIENGPGDLLWDRNHTNALKQGFDNTSQQQMQWEQDYIRKHPDELRIGQEGYEEQRKKKRLEDTLPKPYASESTGIMQPKINFEEIKALEILKDLNIKKENKNYGNIETLTAEEADRIRPKRPRTKAETNDAYRKWANSTPELTKKYGKESQYNLDATGKPNEWFDKAYKAGEEAYKNSLLPPKAPNLHLRNYSKYGGQIGAEDVFIKEWLGSLKTRNNR